jgi:hypothetical protein
VLGDVVVQLHEHGAIGDGTVRLSLLLDDVAEHVRVVPIALSGFSLPPGASDVELSADVVFPGDASQVLGVMPHLHRAGRSALLTENADEHDGCLVDAPHFDFAFQEVAFYETPIKLGAGERLRLRCAWNTDGRTAPTTWGESSDDEMCTVFLFTTSFGGRLRSGRVSPADRR